MAAARATLTENDEAEWARFAGRIVPLRGRQPVEPPVVVQSIDTTPAETIPHPPSPRRSPAPAPLGIDGKPAGVDTATWQRFHRGRLDYVRKLDLHGMTAQAAFSALRAFLRAAHAERVRCVEVVTGRGGEGGGVLRRELPHWLNLPEIRPLVLAAAHPRTSSAMHAYIANPGSVRLLIRRSRA